MALTTSELTVGDISKLQAVMGNRELKFDEFADAFQEAVGQHVDREMLRLTFELVDSDGDGHLTFKEFQEHIQQLRRDEALEQAWRGNRDCFQEVAQPAPQMSKHLHHSATIKRIVAPSKMDSLITCGLDGSVRVWNAATLEYERTMHYSTYGCSDMYYDEGSDTLAVATCDQAITLYAAQTGKLLRSFRAGRPSLKGYGLRDEVYRHQFRAPKPTPTFTIKGKPAPELEGSTLKKYWNAKHGMMLQRVWAHKKHIDRFPATVLPETKHSITSVSCCPYESQGGDPGFSLFVAQNEGSVDLYRPNMLTKNDDELFAPLKPFSQWKPHRDAITAIRREPDSDNIVTSSRDSDIQILNVERGIVLKTLKGTSIETLRSHTRGVYGFEFCRKPKLLGSWGNERYAILWDPLVAKPLQTLHGHVARLVDLKFSPTDANMIFTYSEDRTVRVWDLRTFRCLQQIRERSWETLGSPGAIHYDSKRNAVVTATSRLYRKEAVKTQFPENYKGHTRPVLAVTFCEAEDVICTCDEVSLRVWDAAQKRLSIVWPLEPIHGICLDSRGFEILVDVGGGDLQVISTNSGQPVLVLTGTKCEHGHHDPRYVFWEKGYWIVSTSTDLLFYEDICDQKIVMYPSPAFSRSLASLDTSVSCLAISGQRLIIGLQDGGMSSIPLRYLQNRSEEPLFLFHRLANEAQGQLHEDDFTDLSVLGANWMSLFPGPLHHDVRKMIKNAVRSTRLRESLAAGLNADTSAEQRANFPSSTDENDAEKNAVLTTFNDFMNRVESIVTLNSRFIVSSNGLGVLTLWDVSESKELLRWLVTLAPKIGVSTMDVTPDGKTMFYGDDMGYVGAFDMSEVLTATINDGTTPAQLGEMVKRISLFRADDSPIASVKWLTTSNRLCVGTATNNLIITTIEGERESLLGTDMEPPHAGNTSQYLTLMKMFRQEFIMQHLGNETRSKDEIVASVHSDASFLFEDEATIVKTLLEMCPSDPEKDKERLLDRSVMSNGEEGFTSLREKELPADTTAKSGGKKTPKNDDSWETTDAALFQKREPKPFRRNLITHSDLLNEISALATKGDANQLSLMHSDSSTMDFQTQKVDDTPEPLPSTADAGTQRRMKLPPLQRQTAENSADTSAADSPTQLQASTRTPSLRDAVRKVQLTRLSGGLRMELRPKPHEPLPKHEAYGRQVLEDAQASEMGFIERSALESLITALFVEESKCWLHGMDTLWQMFQDSRKMILVIFDPEKKRRNEVHKQELRARRMMVDLESRSRAHVIDVAERPNAVRYLLEPSSGSKSFHYMGRDRPRHSRQPCPQRQLLESLIAPTQSRRSSSMPSNRPTQTRPRSRSQGAKPHPTRKPFHWWDVEEPERDPTASWDAAWRHAMHIIPLSEAMAADKQARVDSLVFKFKTRCEELVEEIMLKDISGTPMDFELPFVWKRDGIALHCVTNPITTRCCGTLDNAAKLASLELNGISAFIAGQEKCAVRVNVPLACVVKYCGHTFFCSSLVPMHPVDALPVHEDHNWVADEAFRQAFDAINLEWRKRSVDIPIGFRMFQGDSGHLYAVGFRRLFPPQWNTASTPTFCVHTLRPELVCSGSTRLSANAYDPAISLPERKQEDRNATKAARRIETAIAQVVSELEKLDSAIVDLRRGAITKLLHEKGISLRFMARVAFGLEVRGKQLCSPNRRTNTASTPSKKRNGLRVGRPTDLHELLHSRWDDGQAAAEEESGAPYHARLIFEEIVARAMRRIIFAAWRDAKRPTTIDTFVSIADQHIQLLLDDGERGSEFWNSTLPSMIEIMYPHEGKGTISLSDIMPSRTVDRITALCGLVAEKKTLVGVRPRSKTISYKCVFTPPVFRESNPRSGAMFTALSKQLHWVRCVAGKTSPETVHVASKIVELAASCGLPKLKLIAKAKEICHSMFGHKCRSASRLQLMEALMRMNGNDHFGSLHVLEELVQQGENCRQDAANVLQDLNARLGIVSAWCSTTKESLATFRLEYEANNHFYSPIDLARSIERDVQARLATADTNSLRDARDLAVERFEELQTIYDPASPQLLSSMELIAQCHLHLEEEAEATEIHEQIHKVCANWCGRHSTEAAHYIERLGDSLVTMCNFKLALDCYQRSLVTRERADSGQSCETAVPHIKMARLHLLRKNTNHALASLKSASHFLGGVKFDHPILLQKLLCEADCHQRAKNLKGAIECWSKVLDARERTLGPMHPSTAEALFEIGTLLLRQKKFHEAWHTFDVCAGIRKKKLGPSNHLVAQCVTWQARCERALGDEVAASETMRRAFTLFESEMGESDNFPLLKAQLVIDAAVLLIDDVGSLQEHNDFVDIRHLKELGVNADVELTRAIKLLQKAHHLIVDVVQDPHHPSITHIVNLIQRSQTELHRLDAERKSIEETLERDKLLGIWQQFGEETTTKHDPLWYRKAHKIFKLRWD